MKIILIFLILTYTLFSDSVKKEGLEKVSLQLHWKYQFEFAGFIAAKEKGFYEEVGLDVELKEYSSGVDIEDEVISGKSEYGIYNSSSLLDYLKGKPVKLVASFFKRAALVLVTRPDIHSPLDLVGKKIMASTKEDFILNYKPYFDLYGVSVDDVKLVPHTYGIDEFVNGEVAAMTAFISNEVYKLDELGAQYNILDPSDDNLFVLQLELFTSTHETDYHPERVRAFKNASIKGWQYALTHKDEIIDVIYEKYTKKVSKKSMKSESIGVEKLILPYTYNIGSIDKNFLHKQIELFKEYYQVGFDKNLEDFIFDDITRERETLFSSAERKYLDQNGVIKVCLHPNVFPIDGYIKEKHSGIMGAVYDEISLITGVKFKAIPTKSYQDLSLKVEAKECKLVSVLPSKSKKYKNLKMTKPFFQTHFTLISAINHSFAQDPSELRGKKLLVQLDAYKEKVLEFSPYLDIEVENDVNKMMKKVIDNEVFAVIAANEIADYHIDKYGYGELKINGFLDKENVIKGSVGVQKEEPLLFSIMEKSLHALSPQKIDSIVKSWRLTRYHNIPDYSLVYKILIGAILLLAIMMYYQRRLKASHKALEKTLQELVEKDEILTIQSKQAVMGEMMSMIAHQWRQPLSTITLQISNLKIERLMGKVTSANDVDKVLSDISDRIIYLSETVDDFQTYFSPNKKSTEIGIVELFEKALALNIARVKTSGVRIEVDVHERIALDIYVNELIQVLLNIINNALDAFENLDKENKRIVITARVEGQYVYISIEDNAGGIKEQDLERIFEPYFSTKGKNGTGLGLYMSNMIVQKQFGGEINVETSSQGAVFIVKALQNV